MKTKRAVNGRWPVRASGLDSAPSSMSSGGSRRVRSTRSRTCWAVTSTSRHGSNSATFADFKDQVETLARAVLPVVLEERASLESNAEVETAGRCPHCGSEGVYLEKAVTHPEVRSRYGPVVLHKQQARCRSCGGSFSPSGS